jgi:ABC-type multidrug transport system ATPase subunit
VSDFDASPKMALSYSRSYLGVCPQFNAIDTNLTGELTSVLCSLKLTPVRQHLWTYGRLKGVPTRALRNDVDSLLRHAGLLAKADQLATSLSGGNQRKLSLAIALIGDRPVVLIDEFSSGVDPFSKREAWTAVRGLPPSAINHWVRC